MHNLIVGIGGSGKSTLAYILAGAHRARGEAVLVLDPNNDDHWPADFKTTDPARFVDVAKKSRRCALFVDEAGESIGRGAEARERQWITTRARHWGHRTYVIAQRAQQVELTIRNQCTTAYVFRQSPYDARILADQFAEPLLEEAPTLQRGEFILAIACGGARRMRLQL